MEVGESINPFQFLAAFDGEFIGVFHKLALSEIDFKHFKQLFSFRKNIYFLIVISNWLVKKISFSTVIHFFHYFFLPTDNIIRPLLIYMTFKMVFMIGLPWFRTHIAKMFAASTGHKITSHWSFHGFFTPRTYFRILWYPFCISFFFHYLLHPFYFLLAFARVMIITLTAKTKDFTASAANCIEFHVHLDTITAINTCAELIVLICCYKLLTYLLLVFFKPYLSFLTIHGKHSWNSLEKNRVRTITRHAFGKSWGTLDRIFEVFHPAINTKVMIADVKK